MCFHRFTLYGSSLYIALPCCRFLVNFLLRSVRATFAEGGLTLLSPAEAERLILARQLFGDRVAGAQSTVSPTNGGQAVSARIQRCCCCIPVKVIMPEGRFRVSWDVLGV